MLRVSPQKLNLVAQLIRGKKVATALADLEFSRKRIARDVRKCLESAIANAENNHDLDVDELVVAEAHDKKLPMEERFAATLKLAELPRNSSKTRIRNRCELSGRPRAYYRKHRLSRIALRELGSKGLIPGLVKSSW